MLTTWTCTSDKQEYALAFDRARARRLLILPALFNEANKLRHFTAEVMRALNDAEIDSFLPDFSGCNESLAPFCEQSLATWREQAKVAVAHFDATHVLGIRGGALLDPAMVPAVHFAPVKGAAILRGLLRARVLTDKEAGRATDRDTLLSAARTDGLQLAGFDFGAEMVCQLEAAAPCNAHEIAQSDIGGGALWLRAEPAHDARQAATLAENVAGKLT